MQAIQTLRRVRRTRRKRQLEERGLPSRGVTMAATCFLRYLLRPDFALLSARALLMGGTLKTNSAAEHVE